MASAKFKPLYVLHGTDEFLRDLHRREIIASFIGDADPQLCVSDFDATAELSEVLDELRTLPFLAPCRIVVVRDADAFVSAHREALEKFLAGPPDTAALVLIMLSWRKDTRLAKLAKKIGETFDCSKPNTSELARRLKHAAAKRAKKLSAEAARLLCDWIGPDLGTLDAEVEKLSLYVGDRETIGPDDVCEMVTVSAGPAAFALTNAITDGDASAALEALGRSLTIRGAEFMTLGQIAWHLRRALRACRLLDAGTPMDQAIPRMPPSAKKAFAAMLRRKSTAAFGSDFRSLIRCDLAMKSGDKPKSAMKELVVALCT